MGSIRRLEALDSGWSLCKTPAGTITTPLELLRSEADRLWIELPGLGTVASSLRALGLDFAGGANDRLDAHDWWFRAKFDSPAASPRAMRQILFGGLATLAEVWLNGAALLQSSNMHLSHICEGDLLRDEDNELLLRFASLDHWLAKRRPRPRWRAPMVENQQLRGVRTSLLGHMPGWSPPTPAIGPWRGVALMEVQYFQTSELRLSSDVVDGNGRVSLSVVLAPVTGDVRIESAHLVLERSGAVHRAPLIKTPVTPNGFSGTLQIADPDLWWPHTHGEPELYEASLVVKLDGIENPESVELNAIGFRTIGLDTAMGDFALSVNGVPVFCRGACWMPIDALSVRSTPEACHASLEQARDAGMNMLRVIGPTVYEEDHFHDSCDRLGILVWQDFMFANMDYSSNDSAFLESVRLEVTQHLARWQARPSLAILCGNSEVEQQASMWGAPRTQWSQELFTSDVAQLCARWCPNVAYWPSSAHGGSFPHRNDQGTSSYYGVGAYLRPFDDIRRSNLRFASECLAIANVPAESTISRMPGGAGLRTTHAAWRERSPRDLGAGWDFDDVRDHYFQRIYGVDPTTIRGVDHERYLALSRAVSAEVIRRTFAELRRPGSNCRGAITLGMRDLWEGAGWGLIDSLGVPKAAYYGMRSALAPRAIFFSDEGNNGLDVHVINEASSELSAVVEIALFREDGHCNERTSRAFAVPPRGAVTTSSTEWFEYFIDLNWTYRFGPTEHAVVVATLRTPDGAFLGDACHVVRGLSTERDRALELVGEARVLENGSIEATIRCNRLAQSVYFDAPGFTPHEEYFHLPPGAARTVRFSPLQNGQVVPFNGRVCALNSWYRAPLTLKV